MTDRPIPMTRAMALASWRGDKTETRRILDPQPPADWNPAQWGEIHRCDPETGEPVEPEKAGDFLGHGWFDPDGLSGYVSPYCPGDRLWVREPYWQRGYWRPIFGETTKGGAPKWAFSPMFETGRGESAPAFDPPAEFRQGLKRDGTQGAVDWYRRLGRFMPRAYSRQTSIVTGVKVERLQRIDDAGALREGIRHHEKSSGYGVMCDGLNLFLHGTPRDAFRLLWASINGPNSWDANPWVTVVSYRTIRANIDSHAAAVAAKLANQGK